MGSAWEEGTTGEVQGNGDDAGERESMGGEVSSRCEWRKNKDGRDN